MKCITKYLFTVAFHVIFQIRSKAFLQHGLMRQNPTTSRHRFIMKMAKNKSSNLPQVPVQPEFSRIVSLTELSRRPKKMQIEANAAEMAAVAERFRLKSISKLVASVSIERITLGTSSIVVQGTVDAEIVQICVSTLQAFDSTISETFRTVIKECSEDSIPGSTFLKWNSDGQQLDIDDDWDEEVPSGGNIDVGEIAAQYMGLSIDLFGKAPGYIPINPLKSL